MNSSGPHTACADHGLPKEAAARREKRPTPCTGPNKPARLREVRQDGTYEAGRCRQRRSATTWHGPTIQASAAAEDRSILDPGRAVSDAVLRISGRVTALPGLSGRVSFFGGHAVHRVRRRAGDGRVWVEASRCLGFAAATGRRSPPGPPILRHGRSVLCCGMGTWRPVSVTGSFAGRSCDRFG